MSSDTLLSSEQALDEYFSALLDETIESEEFLEERVSDKDGLPEPEPLVQSVEEKSYYSAPTLEVEVPNLDDVERLLEQLESTNPVAELQLEEVMEQNTVQIAEAKEAVEEIQEWDVEIPDAIEVSVEPELDVSVDETLEVEPEPETFYEEPEIIAENTPQAEPETETGGSDLGTWHSTIRDVEFQVLYFDVNGVTFAVPLDELGGIHRIAELNHLIGRPDWYLGLQTSREAQLDVVDTAKWVMAEKLVDDSYKDEYQYIVMLDESMWGLASTQLKGTESLNPEKVRWRKTAGKRPWLAGMVKEKMCALIHVEALIAMLNAGLDVKALDK
ncbi:chemotaxis protein CheW [Vibrio neptunius]|uniref:Chemotaxis protein CheW n=1 Tax=Vibrio neptunius TaxID=170651 RepID=A0ABS2ZZI0_9VIBR|nr:chemotaxis protein CheW [Vibrio neptunius]MBN3491648.1 chemotaxis protein CheW [Vibrio neptunius]MBN3514171.1 chemotaxis protein CheW [Vibrio neptunius]MBN3549011.1 chemotaxis protein CheW [Vibrio neptunius]MBN3577473.1 chemotaxis protein CheW [Vibrio neptunius]MCH9871137.1 chemotaxis protein CheW [Vibrio neptunius]